jgi:hypothetical protein
MREGRLAAPLSLRVYGEDALLLGMRALELHLRLRVVVRLSVPLTAEPVIAKRTVACAATSDI